MADKNVNVMTATATNNEMRMIAGLDIGNGYVKGLASVNGGQPVGIDFLSGTSLRTSTHDIKTPLSEIDKVMPDIFNNLDIGFDSTAVENHVPRLFGSRGVNSGGSFEEFDVSGATCKARQDLSAVLILGCLAGRALQEYWNANKKLPTDLIKVRCVELAVALPITDYKDYRRIYAERFTSTSHMISIYNFETVVRVEVLIDDVQVLAEGASAQFAIASKGIEFMDAMLADLRAHGERLEGVTARDILSSGNTLSVDIGEGTVNFPVFQGSRFNPDASKSYNHGYGNVLEASLDRLKRANMQFSSRKALTNAMLTPVNSMNRTRLQKVREVVDSETRGFVMEVVNEFKKVMRDCGSYVEVIYVYGGGANSVKDVLYPELIETSKSYGGEDIAFPILYLDHRYSRYLNRDGLYLIAEQTWQKKASGK